jgi:hypothetical protein
MRKHSRSRFQQDSRSVLLSTPTIHQHVFFSERADFKGALADLHQF